MNRSRRLLAALKKPGYVDFQNVREACREVTAEQSASEYHWATPLLTTPWRPLIMPPHHEDTPPLELKTTDEAPAGHLQDYPLSWM